MNPQLGLTLKILTLSLGLSFAIKYGGQLLPVAPTPTNALMGIAVLPLSIGLALWWRAKQVESGTERD